MIQQPALEQMPSLDVGIAELAARGMAEHLAAQNGDPDSDEGRAIDAVHRAWQAERLLRESELAPLGLQSECRHCQLRAQAERLVEGVEAGAVSQPVHGTERWYLHLLGQVAAELDRLAIGAEPSMQTTLGERAQRIRRRIHEGPPEGWVPPQQPASEPL